MPRQGRRARSVCRTWLFLSGLPAAIAGARVVAGQVCIPGWSALGPGLPRPVSALTVFDDGSGPALIAGEVSDTSPASGTFRVARWDGFAWIPVGNLGPTNSISLIEVTELADAPMGGGVTRLVALGWFRGPTFNPRSIWFNGTEWLPTPGGGGPAGSTGALVFDDGTGPALFVSVWSTVPLFNSGAVVKWNGSQWTQVAFVRTSTGSKNFTFGSVLALAAQQDGPYRGLYYGGHWGNPPVNVAGLYGGNVGPLPSEVSALGLVDDGAGARLWAAGLFGLRAWSGTAWESPPQPPAGGIKSILGFDDGAGYAIYVGGGGVARFWNGAWQQIGGNAVNAMVVHDDGTGPALFVGGVFAGMGGVPSPNIVRWGRLACRANCDGSRNPSGCPTLNADDFTCFLNRFAAGDYRANCDASTAVPSLNVNDFVCFTQRFAAGCF